MNYNDLLHTNSYQETYFKNEKKRNTNTRNEIRPKNIYFSPSREKSDNSHKPIDDLLNTNNYNFKKDKDQDLSNLYKQINDSNDNKHQYIKKTLISVFSEDRNMELYTVPNNFSMNLNRVYKNIKKIVLKDIYIQNSIPFLNQFNNRFTWQYPSKSDNDEIFIPPFISGSTNKEISFIGGSCNNFLPDVDSDNLIYSSQLNIKYSTVQEFTKAFSYELGNNFHYIKNLNDFNNENKELFEERDNREFENADLDLSKNQILFDVDINPLNHIVKIINRSEKISIYAYQTVNKDEREDIFENVSISSPKLQKNKIYITITKDDYDLYLKEGTEGSFKACYPFPLIITNIKSIGNINKKLINYTPFYSYELYAAKGASSSPVNVSTYKLFDTLEFKNGGSTIIKFIRLELTLSSGNINGLFFNEKGQIIQTNKTQNIITSSYIEDLINGTTTNYLYTINQNEEFNMPQIGRAMPFRVLDYYKDVEDDNKIKNNSILTKLGWPNKKSSENIQNITFKKQFYFVHSNVDSFNKNIINKININNIYTLYKYLSPQKKLEIEYNGYDYSFKSIPFIYLKILPSGNNIAIDNQLIRLNEKKNKKLFKKEFFEKISNKEYHKLNTDNILAKIYLNPIKYMTTIMPNINYEYTFYDNTLETLDKIKIIITDPYGEIINIETEYSFTLEIQERINILKNTLLDTRRGNKIMTPNT